MDGREKENIEQGILNDEGWRAEDRGREIRIKGDQDIRISGNQEIRRMENLEWRI